MDGFTYAVLFERVSRQRIVAMSSEVDTKGRLGQREVETERYNVQNISQNVSRARYSLRDETKIVTTKICQ